MPITPHMPIGAPRSASENPNQLAQIGERDFSDGEIGRSAPTVRGSAPRNVARTESAIACTSPTGTNRPHFPPSRISEASADAIGADDGGPQASACINALGQPSVSEEHTTTWARRHPSERIIDESGEMNVLGEAQFRHEFLEGPPVGPSPRMASRQSQRPRMTENARINVGKSLRTSSLPTASNNGESRCSTTHFRSVGRYAARSNRDREDCR